MALAVLRYEGIDGGQARFLIDIGKNRYYAYAIGDKEVQQVNGLTVLRNRKFADELLGPLPEAKLGRSVLQVSAERFDRENCYIQLMSFRTKERVGPAISDIIRVGAYSGLDSDLPAISFGTELNVNVKNQNIDTVPFRYREGLSSGMFLNILTSLLPTVAPMVSGLLGNLAGSGGSAAPLSQAISNPETARVIADLLQKLLAGQVAGQAHAHTLAVAVPPQYSQATIAPALLAALPSLLQAAGPIAEKLLNPETLKALNIFQGFAEIGVKQQQQVMDHLKDIMKMSATEDIERLFQGLSLGQGVADPVSPAPYHRVKSVHLALADVNPVTLNGRPRLLYGHNTDIALPLTIESPRSIRLSTLKLTLKDPSTLRVLVEQKYRMENINLGRLDIVPTIPHDRVAALRANEEYLVCFELTWRDRSNNLIGTHLTQLITLMGEYVFDRVEQEEKTFPLNDVVKYRQYWHKVWQNSFTDSVRRRFFDCKYYYVLEKDRTENARMETVTKTEQTGPREESGRLKSGLILSLFSLNELLNTISSQSPLNEAELAALQSDDFVEHFNHAARAKVKFHGRTGDSAALWVYPEVKLQRLILKQIDQMNTNGHVLTLAEHTVVFPMPTTAHFIGASTES